jgi:hypothetical protein
MTRSSNWPASRRSLILATIFAGLILAAVALAAGTPRATALGAPGFTGGVISGNTTWTNALTITSPITVTSGATLTISPGVEVRFDPGTWLRIEGRLDAEGTQAQQIRLIRTPSTPPMNPWQGVIATQPTGDVYLRSVTIANAVTGLAIPQPVAGVAATRSRIDVLDSRLEFNNIGIAANYIGATSATSLTLRSNLLTHNQIAMQVLGLPSKSNKLKLNHNSFVGNGIGLKVTGPGSLKAQQQWWGSAAGPLVGDPLTCAATPIPGAGDLVCGPVDFSPWSKVPNGRMILDARAGGILESGLGLATVTGDDTLPSSTATLTVPAGTFDQQVDLLMSGRAPAEMPPVQPGLQPTQLFLEVTAVAGGQEIHQFAGSQPLRLTIRYVSQDLNGVAPSKLVAYYWDEALGTWSTRGLTTALDPAHQEIIVQMQHLSRIMITGVNFYTVELPIVIR